jgi:hypothetical protein
VSCWLNSDIFQDVGLSIIHFDHVDGTLQAAGLNHMPGTLFALPLIDFPAGFIKAFIDWELPKGRHQDDHYLHPAVPPVSL